MGDENESTKRKDAFSSYQVNEKVLDEASSDVIFLHCLPAKRGQEISENLYSMILEAVFGIKPKIDFMHKKVFF